MKRFCLVASMLLVLSLFSVLTASSARAASASAVSAYSDLHGKHCQTIDTTAHGASRLCRGVAGYALVVYDNDDRSSVDIVAPDNSLYPLSYWDVVTPGYSTVGQKAEWRMETRKGKRVPTALMVRLSKLDPRSPGEMIAVARIYPDGACVVFRGDLVEPAIEAAARRAAIDPASKCLGYLNSD